MKTSPRDNQDLDFLLLLTNAETLAILSPRAQGIWVSDMNAGHHHAKRDTVHPAHPSIGPAWPNLWGAGVVCPFTVVSTS